MAEPLKDEIVGGIEVSWQVDDKIENRIFTEPADAYNSVYEMMVNSRKRIDRIEIRWVKVRRTWALIEEDR